MIITIIRTYTVKSSTGFVYEIAGRKAASFAKSAEALAASLGAELPGQEAAPTVDEVIKDLNDWYEGQVLVERWTPAPKPGCGPQDRVYVTFVAKWNGGKNWNGGIGGRGYVDLVNGTWAAPRNWAGAATRKHWEYHIEGDDGIVARLLEAKR